jgi:hypothetical protein
VLLGAAHDGVHVEGHGAVPAQVARNLVANGLDANATWVRRLYADPDGQLVATTSAARLHAPGPAALLRVRDQGLCRTPYCDAPIRQLDHVVPAADGGPTSAENSQGLCEACNHAKQAPGWTQRPEQAGVQGTLRHTVVTTTPTGHRYRSIAPPPPRPLGHGRPTGVVGAVEERPGPAATALEPDRSAPSGIAGETTTGRRPAATTLGAATAGRVRRHRARSAALHERRRPGSAVGGVEAPGRSVVDDAFAALVDGWV